ncbi:hypothetical protein SESBI_50369 [Sesbania bispinosa]|nr:hypothetical protein SESBI_50369 [Sesbania bispinosa]
MAIYTSQKSPTGERGQNIDYIVHGTLPKVDDPVISQVMFLSPLRVGIPLVFRIRFFFLLVNTQVVYTNPMATSMPIRAVTSPKLLGNS